jgi:hypothetical protein
MVAEQHLSELHLYHLLRQSIHGPPIGINTASDLQRPATPNILRQKYSQTVRSPRVKRLKHPAENKHVIIAGPKDMAILCLPSLAVLFLLGA